MQDKILGGLYGQALGDSWAMPALFIPEDTWNYYHGWIDRLLDAPDSHPFHRGLHAGQVTDDTEQAFAVAEAIIQDGKVTPEGVARAVVGWYDRINGDTSPYVGPSTRRAVMAMKRGEDIYKTGVQGDTNGASMRVSPVGLINPGKLQKAVHDTYLSCIPTHNTAVAVSGAAAVAGAISVAMQDGSTLDEIVKAGQMAAEMGKTYSNHWIGASVARRIALAVEIATEPADERERLQELYDVVGATLAITESVPAAFGVLVMANGDPHQTAIYAAALSGDADTIAAMACAIAGAWKGAGAFDRETMNIIKKANPAFDFEGTAQKLARLI